MNEPRLRGNTFIALLLRAGVQELSEKPEWGENNNGITRPNMFADLLRMTQPAYDPPKTKSLSSYFSRYLKGEIISSPMYFAFNTPAYQHGLATRIQDDYLAVLHEMDRFCHKYLRSSDVDRRQLVGGLVDAILADSTFNGRFDTGEKWVDKTNLNNEKHFILQPFLVSVWNTILEKYPDASEGAETYMDWTEEIAYGKPRETTTAIGTERAKKIAVSVDLPEEMQTDTAEEVNEDDEPADDNSAEGTVDPEVIEVVNVNPDTGEKNVAHIQIVNNGSGPVIAQANGLVININ